MADVPARYVYRFVPARFAAWPEADGYWVADEDPQLPSTSRRWATCSSATPTRGIELRVARRACAPCADAVVESRLPRSRWRRMAQRSA